MESGTLVPRGPVAEDVMLAITERASAIFSSHKHKVSGELEPQQVLYALALVGAMLGLNQKQLDAELQISQKLGRRSLSYEDFMTAVEAMVALHGNLAHQQTRRLPGNDMSQALRSAFNMYVKLNVGGFVGGDQRMNSHQFTKMCQDAGIMEPNGPASNTTLQIAWSSCKATFGSTRLQYNQFLKIIGALAAELSGDVFLLVAGLGLQLATVPQLRNGFRKPDAADLPKPELVQGMGAHMAAEAAYEQFMQEGKIERGGKERDPLARPSPARARGSLNGSVPNWVKAMQADQGGGSVMTSGQDIRGIPVIETPDSDDEGTPRRQQPRKSMAPTPPDDSPGMGMGMGGSQARGKPSPVPLRPMPPPPRGGKLGPIGGGDPSRPFSPSNDPDLYNQDEPMRGTRNTIAVTHGIADVAPMSVKPRDSGFPDRMGMRRMDEDPLEPSILGGTGRVRASMPEIALKGDMAEAVQRQQAAVKQLEAKLDQQQKRESEMFDRVRLLTEKLAEAQSTAATQVQSGCPGAEVTESVVPQRDPITGLDLPQAIPRKIAAGRCPLTDQVNKLTEQMAEVMNRLEALESIKLQPKQDERQRNPIAARVGVPVYGEDPSRGALAAPKGGLHTLEPGAGGMEPLEPVLTQQATQNEYMQRLMLNLDQRMRSVEGTGGKEPSEEDAALADVFRQLKEMQDRQAGPTEPAFRQSDRPVIVQQIARGEAPPLQPTGDPEMDRKLKRMADEMAAKNAAVGMLLDMLSQTRNEVAALTAEVQKLKSERGAGGAAVMAELPPGPGMPAPDPGQRQRNPIRVVDGGFVSGGGAMAAPNRPAGQAGPDGAYASEPQLEAVMSDQQAVKRAVRDLYQAIGVAPPPAVASAQPTSAAEQATPARAGKLPGVNEEPASASSPEGGSPWGQPGRPKNIREETQEVKQQVQNVQQDVGELKKALDQMRAIAAQAGDWPRSLPPGAAGQPGEPGLEPALASSPEAQEQQRRRGGAVAVVMSQPVYGNNQMMQAPQRLTPGQAGQLEPLPEPAVQSMQQELRQLKAYVGMPQQAGAMGQAGAMAGGEAAKAASKDGGQWGEAGRLGPGGKPLGETVQTVSQDVDQLKKHVKAMDAALRTNIQNTNQVTTVLNENMPAIQAAAQLADPAKAAEAAKAGRNPIQVTQMAAVPEPAGMQAKRAGLPLQSEGMEPGSLDPAEVQQLREQVKNLSRFVGMPGEAGAPGAQGQQQEPQRRGNAIAVVSGDRAMGSSPWGQPGRLNAPGQGGSVAEGLGQVSGDVERLKKQVAAMGSAMQAAGMQLPPEAMGEGADGAAGMPPPEPVIEGMGATRSRAPIQVQTGMPQYGQGQMAQAPNKLPPQSPGAIEPVAAEVSNLRREVAAMKQVLAMSPATAQHAAAMASQQPLQQERGGMSPEKAAAVASEPWGQGPRPASLPVDQMQRAPQSDNLSKDLEAVKRRQVELEDAMRAGGLAVPPPGGAPGMGNDSPAAREEARKRNPVMVAATVPEYGQSNMNAPNRAPPPLEQMQGVPEPVVAHLGAMQNDLRQMQQFLGMRQVSQDPSRPQQPGQPVLAPMDRGPAGAPASQPWGNTRDGPGGEPRVEKLSDLVKEVQDARARQEGVEKVLRSMGASMPWDDGRQPGGAGPGQAGPDGAAPEPGSQAAQRRGNAIAVTGGAPVYGQPGMQAPERAAQAGAAPGAPAQLEPQLQQVTEELRRVQNFLGLPPQQMGAAGQAGPGAGPGGRGADPAQAGRGGPQDQWGAPGRDRQWGEQPKNLGEVLRDVDYSKRRVKELEDAMRAAGINVPPPGEGAGPGEGGLTPEQQAAQRSRNPVTVAAGVPDVGQLKAMPPMGKPVYGADGQPEPTQAEVARLNEEVKRMQQVLNNIAPGQLQQQGQQPGQEGGRGKGGAVLVNAGPMEPWGAAGRDPKLAAPGEAKSVADIGRELDQTKRRMHQLEDAMRAAGIPLPPPEGAEPGLEPNLPDSAVSSAGRPRQGVNVMASNANYGPQSYNAQGKLKSLEGLPEPAQAELNRMAEEIKRMQQVMSMQPSSAERMGQPPEPRGSAAAAAPAEPARGAQEEWGGPGRPATLPEPVRNMGDVVKNLEDTNQRLAQLEQMMGVMPGAAGAPQPGAGGEGEAAKQEEQRRRGPVAVVAAVPMYGGPGQVAPNRGPGGAAGAEGAAAGPLEPQLQSMAEDMRKMKQVLGIQPVMQSAPGVQAAQAQGRGGPQDPGMSGLPESWGQPGREPRQQGDPPRNMGEVVKDVDYNTRRTRQLEDAMRAAGIPVPPPPTDGPGKGDGGQWAGSTPEEVAARKRNAINVQGGHPDYGPPTYAAPGTKLKSLEGLPEPAQAEISNLAHEVKRLQQFMNMNPPGQAPPPAKAAPALEPMRAAELPKGANDPWSQPGRDPRMPGEPPRNMGDMVQELDKSQKRMAQLEDAMRAAGINVPPPEGAGPGAGESPAEQQQAQQRQRNTIAVVASTPDYGPKLSAPPGKKLQSLEGLPEPAKAELEKMADDIKRLQQFMAMGGPEQAAMQPMLEPQVKQMPGQPGAPPQMQQWGQPGAPRMPGESPKNMGEVVKDVDQTKRRVHQLEDAMRAAGIPIPPPDGPGGPGAGGEYEGSSPEEIARGKRNPIGVKAGNPEYGEKAFGAPGRNPALADLPAPVAAELQRMDQELKKVQQFMNMNPPGQAPPPAKAAPALEPMRAAELPKGANDPWSQPGRDPRMPADAPKSIADMVQEMDSNRKRINELEDALRAAGIPFKPADGSALAGEAEREQQQQAGRPKRNTVVAVASVPDYGPGLKAPGQKLQSLEGLPEPAKAELEKMADDIKRLQQFMAMGGPEQAAMQPMLEPQVKQMPGQPGAAPQFQQWGQAGRDPRMPEVAPKNIGEVVKDVDQTKRRVHQLEDAMRAAGIPVPPPDGAAGMEGSSPEAQAEAERRRNAIGVKAGNPEYGEKAFGAPGRNPALAGLPPAAQAELQRMDDDMRRMQQQMQQMGPALAAAQQAAAANASEPGAADGRGPNEQWGGPGRPAALPEPIQAAGNTAQEVEQTKRRIKELEDAMQAAGIPLRPGEAPAGAPGAEAEKDKEQARPKRNAVGVVAVAPVYGPNSFNAPERKPNLEGVPEPVKAELQAMADDIKRMHQFMAMPPPVIQPMPEKPGQAPQRAMPGQPGAPQQMQQWGQPGRPREPGEPPRNMGEVVNDLDNNRKRIRELEDAVRAAGIPIQPADGPSAASVPEGATPEEVARARRNPIGVTAGNPEYADQRLAAPGRNAPAAVPPEAVQAELQQLKDEVKRVQQHLGMPPPGQAPAKVAAVPLEPMRAAEVQRPGPQEQWGQPGREPRKPGEPPRNMEEAAKDVADVKKQMAQMADAIRAAGIPFNPPPEPGAEADKQGEAPGRPKRNPIAVSAGNPEYANQKFSAPEKAAAMASLPEPVKAEIKDLRRELERLKNHTGLPPPVIAPIPGQPAGRQAMQEVQRPGPQDQWGQPGRPRQPGEPPRNMEEAAKDVADLKKQLGQMADAMRAAGLPVPPGVESANPATPGEQEKAGDPRRARNAVKVTPGEMPADQRTFAQPSRPGEAPMPEALPAKVDDLQKEIRQLKQALGMPAELPAAKPADPKAKPGAMASEAAPWAEPGREKPLAATVKDVAKDVDDVKKKLDDLDKAVKAAAMGQMLPREAGAANVQGIDVKPGEQPGAADKKKNPIQVTAGQPEAAGPGFKNGVKQKSVDVPEGIAEPVVIDGEELKAMKKALGDLQQAVWAQPAAQGEPKKGKSLKEDTDDIKKFVRAMGKDVGAMGNDMQALKKHLDDVENAMNKALANLAGELAKLKAAQDADGDRRKPGATLETAGDNMNDTLNAMAALNAAQQQQLARAPGDNRSDDIDALNEAMRQSENQLARLLAFLKQDVMDRFNVHEKTLIRMAKQIDFVQKLLKGEGDYDRSGGDGGSALTVQGNDGNMLYSDGAGAGAGAGASKYGDNPFGSAFG